MPEEQKPGARGKSAREREDKHKSGGHAGGEITSSEQNRFVTKPQQPVNQHKGECKSKHFRNYGPPRAEQSRQSRAEQRQPANGKGWDNHLGMGWGWGREGRGVACSGRCSFNDNCLCCGWLAASQRRIAKKVRKKQKQQQQRARRRQNFISAIIAAYVCACVSVCVCEYECYCKSVCECDQFVWH